METIEKIKKIREVVPDYSKKKLIIIQSNFTNIYEQINIFPHGVIIAKSDPLQPMVFYLKNKNEIGEINILEKDHFKVVNKVLNEGSSIQFKEKRLKRELSTLNEHCEIYNVTKLVKEFDSKKITKITIGFHRFMLIEYEKLN